MVDNFFLALLQDPRIRLFFKCIYLFIVFSSFSLYDPISISLDVTFTDLTTMA